MRIFALLYSLVLATPGVVWASTENFFRSPKPCETALTRNLQEMPIGFQEIDQISIQEGKIGLPLANFGRKTQRLENQQIAFDSDLGPSLWDERALRQWFELSDNGVLQYGQEALRELMQIAHQEGYCTRGLAPDLCEAVRTSWNITHHFADDEFFIEDPAHEIHRMQGLLIFRWHHDFDYPDSMSPESALELMQILARENLIRHVVSLSTMPKETRLLLAQHPSLLPVSSVFQNQSFDLSRTVIPSDTGYGPPDIRFFVEGVPVLYTMSFPLHKNSVGSFIVEGPLSPQKAAQLGKALDLWVQVYAVTLQHLLRLQDPLQVTANWDSEFVGFRDYEVTRRSRILKFLFHWYLWDQIAAFSKNTKPLHD